MFEKIMRAMDVLEHLVEKIFNQAPPIVQGLILALVPYILLYHATFWYLNISQILLFHEMKYIFCARI